jgi:hypothetical protein
MKPLRGWTALLRGNNMAQSLKGLAEEIVEVRKIAPQFSFEAVAIMQQTIVMEKILEILAPSIRKAPR